MSPSPKAPWPAKTHALSTHSASRPRPQGSNAGTGARPHLLLRRLGADRAGLCGGICATGCRKLDRRAQLVGVRAQGIQAARLPRRSLQPSAISLNVRTQLHRWCQHAQCLGSQLGPALNRAMESSLLRHFDLTKGWRHASQPK